MRRLFIQFMTAAALVATVLSCEKEPQGYEVDDEKILLEAFGPNPLMRGNDLTFVGQNLDKITSVVLPVDVEIPSAQFKDVTPNGFKIAVPIEVEAGNVVLKYDGGEIKATSVLTYVEAFSIEKVTYDVPELAPGDSVYVEGEYLYNVASIGFFGNSKVSVSSEEFGYHTRYKISFAVPRGCVSGKIFIADANGNQIPSETEITVKQPVAGVVAPAEALPGAEVTISGSLLTSVDAVVFSGAAAIDASAFVAVSDTEITVEVPADAHDGNVTLVTAAGNEVMTTNAFTVTVPAGLAITAEDRYKAGQNVVITGSNLWLVTGVSFGSVAAEFVYEDEKIKAVIPATAVNGIVTLSMASGKTVETPAIELVTPVIGDISPVELYAGETFTVSGTDLDLVTGLTLGGKEAAFELTGDALTVTTDLSSVTGTVVATLANGVTVTSDTEVTIKYHSVVIITEMPAGQHIGLEVVLKGSNFDMVENIFIGEEKVTRYSLRTPEEVRFLMPWNKVGMYTMSFHLFNGDVENVATQIEVKNELEVKTIWTGSAALNWNAMQDLAWGGYDWSTVKPGTVLTAYFELDSNADYWQVRFANGSWGSLPSGIEIAGGEGNIPMTAGATCYSLTLSAADIDMLVNAGGLVMTGANYTLTRIDLTTEIPQERAIWEGNVDITWAVGGRVVVLASAFEGVSAGTQMVLHYDQKQEVWGQMQLNYGDWSTIPFPEYPSGAIVPTDVYGWEFDSRQTSVTLTQDILDNIQAKKGDYGDEGYTGVGLLIQGSDLIFTKITLK